MTQDKKDTEALIAELDAVLGAGVADVTIQPAPAPNPPARHEAETPAAAPEKTGPGRILVVDDDKSYRVVVEDILTEHGYEVVTARNGARGLIKALDQRPDLVLLDFNMPEMNGYEVVRELRSRDETRKIPIVMLSGAVNIGYIQELRIDIDRFLVKPVSPEQLLETIAEALQAGSRRLPAATPELAPASAPEVLTKQEELLVDIEKDDDQREEEYGLEAMANDSPLVSWVNKILVRAVELGVSDIHFEPKEKEVGVRVRLNGSLQRLCALPGSLAARLAARLKIMSNLVITERRRPQDGQFRATVNGKKIEFRVSSMPSTNGEKIVLRVLGGTKLKPGLVELGLAGRDLKCVARALHIPHGLILVTGPSGSGKTTSLYTMLSKLNKPDVNVMTAEEPVEYRLPDMTQVDIKPAIGLTFESVLRSFLRQDPDIMLVGEIRDLETADIAVKASITGHLVLSSLHTNSAPSTVARLTQMGVPGYLVAASLKLVVAQRLLKVLCPGCRRREPVSADEKRLLSTDETKRLQVVYSPVGCPDCNHTGYTDRKAIFEVMPIRTAAMRQQILSAGGDDRIREQALKEGMTPLREAALQAVAKGETSLSEALKIILAE
ncbi:MAG: ATPase, T2SS/T4P/T4SS family [Elusimicrobiota bacterium]